jgi:putative ABC transport system substrate-binding protein
MRRRDFVAGAFMVTVWGATEPASAQNKPRAPRIAIVAVATKIEDITINGFPAFKGYFSELKRLGYVEGANLVVERYSALGRIDRFEEIAQTAVERAPDLLVTWNVAIGLQLKSLTTTIPIIVSVADPIATGLVTNLGRPEANVTGVSFDAGLEIWGKRFQVLAEAVPTMKNARFLLTDDTTPLAKIIFAAVSQAAQRAGISLQTAVVGSPVGPPAYERVFAQMAAERVDGLVVADGAEHVVNRASIVQLAARHRMAAMYGLREFVEAGGLMSYGVDNADSARRMARMTVDILNGKRPGEIPFYQPIKFELLLNRATARALGLEFPASILATADEVIE